jgi:hypothetical protein
VRGTFARAQRRLKGKKTKIGLLAATLYACLCIARVVPNEPLVWTLIAAWTSYGFEDAIHS